MVLGSRFVFAVFWEYSSFCKELEIVCGCVGIWWV